MSDVIKLLQQGQDWRAREVLTGELENLIELSDKGEIGIQEFTDVLESIYAEARAWSNHMR